MKKSQYEGKGTTLDIQRKNLQIELKNKLCFTEKKCEQYEVKYHESLKLIQSLTVCIIL